MSDSSRRQFLEIAGAAAAALGTPAVAAHSAAQGTLGGASTVFLSGDGLSLAPGEITTELARLVSAGNVVPDEYRLEGVVADVEAYFARLLGKERVLFMPTGTLANHLAIRTLARDRRRVVVQDVSHVYNDTGDGCEVLSGLTLLPLAPDRATFNWADVDHTIARTASGRVAARVGAISIESPVRRRSGELFDRAEMLRICREAKEREIGTHLDGARLFIASAYTGISPADYAAPFDTVYVSLWKYFNTTNGAILAGPAAALEGLFHVRRMFGGALWNAWPFALLARRYAEGFVERLKSAVTISETFIAALPSAHLRVERVANGTNVFRLVMPDAAKAESLREHLRTHDVMMPRPVKSAEGAVFTLQVNETWNRTTGAALAEKFQRALG